MQLIPIFLITIGAVGVALLVVSNMLFYAILGEVNGRSTPDERISVIGVNVRFFEVLRRHQSFCPRSRLRLAVKTTATLGIALLMAAFIAGIVRNSQ
jgi:hypothetical protein